MGGEIEGTGERFRMLADALYEGNQSALARAIDMQPGSFTKYARGARRPGAPVLKRLTRLGVNVNWLLTGEGPMLVTGEDKDASGKETLRPAEDVDRNSDDLQEGASEYHPVPLVQVRVGADGGVVFDEVGAPEWLSKTFIRDRYDVEPARLRGFRIACNFMAETIRPGDRVRGALLPSDCALETVCSDGHVYLILEPRGVLVTRLQVNEDRIVLVGDNPALNDHTYPFEAWNENVQPIARILEVVRPL